MATTVTKPSHTNPSIILLALYNKDVTGVCWCLPPVYTGQRTSH